MSDALNALGGEANAAPATETQPAPQQAEPSQTQTKEPSGEQAPSAPPNWYPEEFADLVAKKGWADPSQALKSYKSLESHMGVPEDQLLRMPNPEKPEEFDAFWKKIGRPDAADQYELNIEGIEDGELGQLKEFAFKNNLTPDQANGVFAEIQAARTAANETYEQERIERISAEDAELRREWGAAYDAKNEAVRAASQKYGMDGDKANALVDALGLKMAMNLMADLGSKQPTTVDGSITPEAKNFGVMTPAEANASIAELKSDADFQARFFKGSAKGHKEAVEKWHRLHRLAAGEA